MAGFNCRRDRDNWRTLINTVINCCIFYKAVNFLTSWGIVSFSGRTLLHAFSITVYTSTWQSVVGFVLFIWAPGNPPQFVCCRQCNLPAGAHRQQLSHRGRWSCRVKLAHELLQLIMWDRGRLWQHADRPLYVHCGPVSFAGPVHCYSHNDNT